METALAALLSSCDPQSLSIVKRTFDRYGIHTTTCRTTRLAADTLKHKRFDLLALDFDLRGLDSLLDSCQSESQHVPRAVIGFSEAPLPGRLQKRVRHWVQKPLTFNSLENILKAMHRLIVMEKRTSFRYAVRLDALAAYQEAGCKQLLQNASVLDISQTGLCLRADAAVPRNATTFIDFQLPETKDTLHIVGQVMWSDTKGRLGIRFRTISSQDLRVLRDWLNARCPWMLQLPSQLQLQSQSESPSHSPSQPLSDLPSSAASRSAAPAQPEKFVETRNATHH